MVNAHIRLPLANVSLLFTPGSPDTTTLELHYFGPANHSLPVRIVDLRPETNELMSLFQRLGASRLTLHELDEAFQRPGFIVEDGHHGQIPSISIYPLTPNSQPTALLSLNHFMFIGNQSLVNSGLLDIDHNHAYWSVGSERYFRRIDNTYAHVLALTDAGHSLELPAPDYCHPDLSQPEWRMILGDRLQLEKSRQKSLALAS